MQDMEKMNQNKKPQKTVRNLGIWIKAPVTFVFRGSFLV
jgi:hypothetical protein